MTDLIEAPELKQLGTQALQDLLTNLTQAKGFILEQAPEFCQQVIARQYVELAGWAAWGLFLLTTGAIAAYFVHRDREHRDGEITFLLSAGCAAPIFAGAFISIAQATNLIRLYVAPKVYLVEEIMRMLK